MSTLIHDLRFSLRLLAKAPGFTLTAITVLALGLLTCAGLFIRSSLKTGGADLGFNAENTVIVEADASLGGYDETRATQLYRSAAEKLGTIPGVQSASIASTVPFGFIRR